MKVPNVLFVKHCPNLSPERKIFLLKHLEERVPIKDIRWVETFNHDDQFVEWLNIKLKLPYGMKLTSNLIKTLMIFKTMIDEPIESALLIDDDVLFHKDWYELFESIPDVIEQNGFINLGTSNFYDMKPRKGVVFNIHNNGGCECMWFSRDLVQNLMANLNLNQAIDIVIHGFMVSIKKPILCVPICHQTSIMEQNTTLDHASRRTDNWISYVQNYGTMVKVNFNTLLDEYETFKKRKDMVNAKFFELYGKRVDIKNVRYIEEDDEEYKLNILTF